MGGFLPDGLCEAGSEQDSPAIVCASLSISRKRSGLLLNVSALKPIFLVQGTALDEGGRN